MAFKDKLIVCFKSGKQVLREYRNKSDESDRILIPFDSDYTIHLKNLNFLDCSIKIYVDGDDISPQKSLLVKPNTQLDILGFYNLDSTINKFKFVKNKNIKSTIDSSFVKIDYQFIQPPDKINISPWLKEKEIIKKERPYKYPWIYPDEYPNPITNPIWYCSNADDGVTIRGEKVTDNTSVTKTPQIIPGGCFIFKLEGFDKLVTTKSRFMCTNCNTKNGSKHKFCYNCGQELI